MKFFITCLLFISSNIFSQGESYKYKLCVTSIFQNEALYLKEWIEYHHKHGVEHFILYNNNSTDHYKKILNRFCRSGLVTLVEWPSVQEENDWRHHSFEIQTGAYNDGLNRLRGISKWVALIDIDEFIVTPNHLNITDLLENEYRNVSGLCVNQQCYGTSNLEQIFPKHGSCYILDKLVWKMKWDDPHNKYSKSIVQPLHVSCCPNPHLCLYTDSNYAIDCNYNRCDACCNEINIDKIRLNHYWTKDKWFLNNVKIPRYKRWGAASEEVMKYAIRMNEEYDPILAGSNR